MFISKATDASPFENSPVCTGVSYGGTGHHIDGAVITVRGRYPKSGYAINDICQELVYVISGKGTLLSETESMTFEAGDVVHIAANEPFAWDSNFVGFFATTPTFNPSQYRLTDV